MSHARKHAYSLRDSRNAIPKLCPQRRGRCRRVKRIRIRPAGQATACMRVHRASTVDERSCVDRCANLQRRFIQVATVARSTRTPASLDARVALAARPPQNRRPSKLFACPPFSPRSEDARPRLHLRCWARKWDPSVGSPIPVSMPGICLRRRSKSY